jgi:hypothetical protein
MCRELVRLTSALILSTQFRSAFSFAPPSVYAARCPLPAHVPWSGAGSRSAADRTVQRNLAAADFEAVPRVYRFDVEDLAPCKS